MWLQYLALAWVIMRDRQLWLVGPAASAASGLCHHLPSQAGLMHVNNPALLAVPLQAPPDDVESPC